MNKIETRTIEAQIALERGDEGTGRRVSGYAAVFDKWSNVLYGAFKEKINRSAFTDCDFSRAIACFNHDASSIMARYSSGTLALSVDDTGLFFSFEAPNTTAGNDLLELISRGDITACSFKFVIESEACTSRDPSKGREYDEFEIMRISDLYDVSPVVHPAYPDTSLDARSLEERIAASRGDDTQPPADEPHGDSQAATRLRDYEFLSLKK